MFFPTAAIVFRLSIYFYLFVACGAGARVSQGQFVQLLASDATIDRFVSSLFSLIASSPIYSACKNVLCL